MRIVHRFLRTFYRRTATSSGSFGRVSERSTRPSGILTSSNLGTLGYAGVDRAPTADHEPSAATARVSPHISYDPTRLMIFAVPTPRTGQGVIVKPPEYPHEPTANISRRRKLTANSIKWLPPNWVSSDRVTRPSPLTSRRDGPPVEAKMNAPTTSNPPCEAMHPVSLEVRTAQRVIRPSDLSNQSIPVPCPW
jgi:hypothetical protein